MSVIPNHPIGFCIFLNLLNFCQLSTANYAFGSIQDFWLRISIVVAIAVTSFLTTFYFIYKWAKKNINRNGQNVIIFSGLHTIAMIFLVFDSLTLLDLWLEPNGIFLTEYIRAGDDMLDSIWFIGIVVIDPLFMGLVDYLIVWRIWKGKSWRSLTIIVWAWIFKSIFTLQVLGFQSWSVSRIHPMSATWISLCPVLTMVCLIPLFFPKNFIISNSAKPNFLNGMFKQALRLFQVLSTILVVSKAMIFQFPDIPLSKFIVSNDPGILLNEKNLVWNYPSIQSYTDLIFVLPTFIASFYYLSKVHKPTWLWDACLTQFVFLGMATFTEVFQSLHPQTPKSFKSDLWNPNFWIINCVSLVTSGVQIVDLIVQRKEIETKTNRKVK